MSIVNIQTVTCPKCGSILEATSDTILLRCKYCKQEIDCEKAITNSNIDYDNRLFTYEDLAENALKVSDFDNAETYYRLICELNSSKENLLRYNICCYLNNTIPYNNSFTDEIEILDKDDMILYLKLIYKSITQRMNKEISEATEYCTTNSVRTQKTEAITERYKNALNSVADKIHIYEPESNEKIVEIKKHMKNLPKILAVVIIVIIFLLIIYMNSQ